MSSLAPVSFFFLSLQALQLHDPRSSSLFPTSSSLFFCSRSQSIRSHSALPSLKVFKLPSSSLLQRFKLRLFHFIVPTPQPSKPAHPSRPLIFNRLVNYPSNVRTNRLFLPGPWTLHAICFLLFLPPTHLLLLGIIFLTSLRFLFVYPSQKPTPPPFFSIDTVFFGFHFST